MKTNRWARLVGVRATMSLSAGVLCLLVAYPLAAQPIEVPPVPEDLPPAVEDPDPASQAPRAAGEAADTAVEPAEGIEAEARGRAAAQVETDLDMEGDVEGDVQVDSDAAAETDLRTGPEARSAVSSRTHLGARLEAGDGALRVSEVASGSVAARAGLRAHDEIISVNGHAVASEAEFDSRLGMTAETDGLAMIRYQRNGRSFDVWVDMTEHSPSDEMGRQERFFRGFDQEGAVQKSDSGPFQKDVYAPVDNRGYHGGTHCGGHRRHVHHRHVHSRHWRHRR
ncbi:MAG: PDZ domain-containing protein [Pirellulaceae bacterium]|nr:PDZ domain-containing protein [Pirellulaceae bacterium]